MSISERYRELVAEVRLVLQGLRADEGSNATERIFRVLDRGLATLSEYEEAVGEIPRMRLDNELSPVLLEAHNLFDRGRLLLEEDGCSAEALKVWELQKKVYRLLNDL